MLQLGHHHKKQEKKTEIQSIYIQKKEKNETKNLKFSKNLLSF